MLKQLQGSIEDEAMASSGQIDLLERLKGNLEEDYQFEQSFIIKKFLSLAQLNINSTLLDSVLFYRR